MNALRKALDDIKFVIPRAVLETVFVKRHQNFRVASPSLDEQILNEVIRPRVYIDTNLVGGAEILVDLSGLEGDEVNTTDMVYRIPKNRTQNRTIMSVLNVTYVDAQAMAAAGQYASCGVSAEQSAAQALLDAVSPLPLISTGRITVIGENVVLIRDSIRIPSNSYLRCIVAHDEAMSHIQPRSYKAFCKLVEYAVKSYIYNEYVVELDMGELRGGHNLGKFKDIIEGYNDSEELYDTYLREKWAKISFQNDRESHNRFLKLLIGGPR
ncbi:hypothetical protein [Ralstonia phage RP31]|uniref:Uncharacterized protein n=1 Tax=Ralstonia phage RP31 TaxID=1923890 RepID=A0A1L7N1C5_9CAUD|nr:hypothetical protein [Ralstonia phage RP31]